jgi:hypothetical protein
VYLSQCFCQEIARITGFLNDDNCDINRTVMSDRHIYNVYGRSSLVVVLVLFIPDILAILKTLSVSKVDVILMIVSPVSNVII